MRGGVLWLQVQTLPPVVIFWPVHHVHKYYCRAVRDTSFNHPVCVFQSAAAAPSPVMGNMPPNDAMPGGPMPPGFFQVWLTPSVTVLFTPPSPPITLISVSLPFAHLTLQKQIKFSNICIFFEGDGILYRKVEYIYLIQLCFKKRFNEEEPLNSIKTHKSPKFEESFQFFLFKKLI